jgi:hypothetical protein
VGPAHRLAVGGVEVGRQHRFEPGNGGVDRRPGQGRVNRLVGRRRLLLPPDRVQQLLPERVVVDDEAEPQPGAQIHQGLGLRLRGRRRAPVGQVSRNV